jgi:hypothetical protein
MWTRSLLLIHLLTISLTLNAQAPAANACKQKLHQVCKAMQQAMQENQKSTLLHYQIKNFSNESGNETKQEVKYTFTKEKLKIITESVVMYQDLTSQVTVVTDQKMIIIRDVNGTDAHSQPWNAYLSDSLINLLEPVNCLQQGNGTDEVYQLKMQPAQNIISRTGIAFITYHINEKQGILERVVMQMVSGYPITGLEMQLLNWKADISSEPFEGSALGAVFTHASNPVLKTAYKGYKVTDARSSAMKN